jgi:hydroxymethylglutaryl-CoA reductase
LFNKKDQIFPLKYVNESRARKIKIIKIKANMKAEVVIIEFVADTEEEL